MMSKIKSKNAAKLKLLFVLPLAAFLVLAFANPKPAKSSEHTIVPVEQEMAGQERQVSEEKVAQAKEELKKLKGKEEKIRQMLATAEDPEKKKELKKSLETVLAKEQEMEHFLQKAGAAPPPVPDGDALKAEYKALLSKEAKIKEELAKTENPEKKAELKALLQKVSAKKEDLQSMMEGNGPAVAEPTIEELKKEYMLLDKKGEEVRAKLAKTTDPQQKAQLEDTLKKIGQKQEQIKIKAQELKKAQEEKK